MHHFDSPDIRKFAAAPAPADAYDPKIARHPDVAVAEFLFRPRE